MSFLPMVERELRAAARKRSTFRLRWWIAALALLATFALLPLLSVTRGPAGVGNVLFHVLSGFTLGLCLLSGMVLTADSLSQERREGTLGLLFLSNLKGCDVVLGKFFAHSLNAAYGLLALLPVMALSLLVGGVTAGEFWRTALALVNTLFISLATAMCVSAFTQKSQHSLSRSLGMLVFLVGGLPALARVAGQAGLPAQWSVLAWPSPLTSYTYASANLYSGDPGSFWGMLLVSHFTGWLALALAGITLPRTWSEFSLGSAPRKWGGFSWPGQETDPAKRAALRANLLPLNPVLWLLSRERGSRSLVWMVVALWGCVVLLGSWLQRGDPGWVYWAAKACGFLLKAILAFEATRFFSEGRQTGALELLLCTPLAKQEILRGNSLALKRVFLLPLAVFLILALLPFEFKMVPALAKGNLALVGQVILNMGLGLGMIGWLGVGMLADCLAVVWFGRWLALTLKHPSRAPGLTVLYVLVVPSLGICGADLVADLFFILWGVSKLQNDLRSFSPVHTV